MSDRDRVVSAGETRANETRASVPFPAIVGQASLKRALSIVATNDALDGALLTGEKGTAKSTAVRALVDLLPDQRAVADCPYGCPPDGPRRCAACRDRDDPPIETRPVPLVTLPLGATRDRVVGTLSVENALAGEAEFDSGLLARANRGILYVDEVNLLDDHLVDVLLDAAASGENVVERDGVSVSHPADFTLIGTMNPEEGDLRPQLRDRFALQATAVGSDDVDERVEIIDRALDRSSDGRSFEERYAEDVARLREDLERARERLPEVELPEQFKTEIAELCRDAGVDGHRGDIATARAATTVAALEGRTTAIESDVEEAASYALPHRLRSRPFEDAPDVDDLLEDRFDDERADRGSDGAETGADEAESTADRGDERDDSEAGAGESGERDESDGNGESSEPSTEDAERDEAGGGEGTGDGAPRPQPSGAEGDGMDEGDGDRSIDGSSGDGSNADEMDDGDGDEDEPDEATPAIPGQRRAEIGRASAPDLADLESSGSTASRSETGSGRARTKRVGSRGSRLRTEPADPGDPIDAAASVRAAARRGDDSVESRDLRRSVRATGATATVVFAVDASASMRPAMRTAKGVVLDLLRDSYERRDEVGFVAFAGDDADVLLPPTTSVALAARHLKELPTGDRTPLPAGLETARAVIDRAESEAAVVVLVTDGRANVADGSPTRETRRAARGLAAAGAKVVVVDAGDGGRAGLGEVIADETDGEVVTLSSLSPAIVRSAIDDGTNE